MRTRKWWGWGAVFSKSEKWAKGGMSKIPLDQKKRGVRSSGHREPISGGGRKEILKGESREN